LKQNACAAFAVEVVGQEQLVIVQEIARPRKMDLHAAAGAIRQAIQTEHRVLVYALVFIKAGTLPKTSSGKIQRTAARELFLNQQLEVIQQWEFPSVLSSEPVPTAPERPLPGQEDIRVWLIARIARQCNVSENQIDPQETLTRYVMDSVSAVSIAMEMQQWLGRAIAPTVLYDSPSVAVLAERLANPQTYIIGESLQLPVSVDQMSQEEVDQALAQLLGGSTTTATPLPPGANAPGSPHIIGAATTNTTPPPPGANAPGSPLAGGGYPRLADEKDRK
jgi:acyl carrier protein